MAIRQPFLCNQSAWDNKEVLKSTVRKENDIRDIMSIRILPTWIKMRIDHVAIAVNDLDSAVKNYEKVLNANKVEVEVVDNEKVRVAMINLQDTRIELMEPTDPSSTISKYLKEHGEGIHHIAITADDIENDLSRASENGVKILGQLRSGSYGRKITFVHPKSMNGVLLELCEAPPDKSS